MRRALIIVDMQEDFINGSLAVPNAKAIIDPIVQAANNGEWDCVVATADAHPRKTRHFDQWPVHCVVGTAGAALDSRIADVAYRVFFKGLGTEDDGYSGFEGATWEGIRLLDLLRRRMDVQDVTVVGVALDYCVKATAIDAANLGFRTHVPLHLTRPVAFDSGVAAISEMMHHDGISVEYTHC